MPIKIPANLPAFDVLSAEGVMVMDLDRAERQDIRALQIGLVNLMPKKIQTEIQFSRLIGATPLQIELTLIRMSDHEAKNTAAEHMETFYQPFSAVQSRKFDGIIITGAPIEHLPFEEVTYWQELKTLFDWTQTHVTSTMGVCWGGMAMIHHFHGVDKHMLNEKAFGCFRHDNLAPASPLLNGFSDDLLIPVSRWTEMRKPEIEARYGLRTLLASDEVGPCLVEDSNHNAFYIFNHLEYDSDTLKQEYDRDVAEGAQIEVPINYYPDDNPARMPKNRWRSHAHLLYGNWLHHVYDATPYDISSIGSKRG